MSKTKRADYWVLREEITGRYFCEYTSVGAMFTGMRGDGKRYFSKKKAARAVNHLPDDFPFTLIPEAVRPTWWRQT